MPKKRPSQKTSLTFITFILKNAGQVTFNPVLKGVETVGRWKVNGFCRSEMSFNEKLGIYWFYILCDSMYIFVIFCDANLTMPCTFSSMPGAIIDSWYARLLGENDAKASWQSWHMWCHCLILWNEWHNDPIEWQFFQVEQSWPTFYNICTMLFLLCACMETHYRCFF